MPDDPKNGSAERLASLERKLAQVSAGLALLGVKPCIWCGTFYRTSDPAALFEFREAACFNCIGPWWLQRSLELSESDRKKAERELRHWLVTQHDALVVRRPEDLPEPEALLIKLDTGCEPCDESGKAYSGRPCHHCGGRGKVWVAVRAPDTVNPL